MSIFDNVNTITINNKEVKSIITSNGAVLYQKADDEYTGVMNYHVTSYIVTCDSTIDPNYLVIRCVLVPFLEDVGMMNGHTLNDLNDAPNITDGELDEFINQYGVSTPVLWSEAYSDYFSDFSELVDGVDITSLNFETEYYENLFVLYSFYLDSSDTGEYMPLKVRYTATDSNNLQAFVTNEIIQ